TYVPSIGWLIASSNSYRRGFCWSACGSCGIIPPRTAPASPGRLGSAYSTIGGGGFEWSVHHPLTWDPREGTDRAKRPGRQSPPDRRSSLRALAPGQGVMH